MQNTTPVLGSLETLAPDLLLFVSGGCHKKCCGPCQPPAQAPVMQQIVQQAPPQILPQAAPPAPPPAPSGPTGDVVTTNVSINGQPVAA